MGSNDWKYGPDQRNQHNGEELGEKIQDLVQGAIDSVDFNGLSDKIKSSIEESIPKVQQMGQDWQQQMEANRQKVYEQRVQAQQRAEYVEKAKSARKAPVMRPREELPVYRELPGRYSGPVSIALGATGLVVAGGMAISSGIGVLAVGAASVAAKMLLGIAAAAFAGSGAIFAKGLSLQKKVKRYLQYQNLWKHHSHITIEDLHKKSGIPTKQITKDLHDIVDSHLLPVSYIDEQETCIILEEETYQHYQAAEAGRKQREQEEEKQRQQALALEQAPANVKLQKQIEADRSHFLGEIRKKREMITSQEMRKKIDLFDSLVEKIYTCVKEYPEQYPQIDRLKDYYLPTIIKLLGTYAQVENQPIQKDNILKTKSEIENSLDMINQAMEVKFDDLFQDMAMDTSADITVLETMLAKDGWNEPVLKPDPKGDNPLVF